MIGVKVAVIFCNDERGKDNLITAYETIASLLLKYLAEEEGYKKGEVGEAAAGSRLHEGKQ